MMSVSITKLFIIILCMCGIVIHTSSFSFFNTGSGNIRNRRQIYSPHLDGDGDINFEVLRMLNKMPLDPAQIIKEIENSYLQHQIESPQTEFKISHSSDGNGHKFNYQRPTISNYKIVNKPALIHENGSVDFGGFKLERTNTDYSAPTLTRTYKIKNIQIKEHPPVIRRINRVQYINGDKVQNIFESFNDKIPFEISKPSFTNSNYDIEKLLRDSDTFTSKPIQIEVTDELNKNIDGLGLIDVRKYVSKDTINHFRQFNKPKVEILRQRGFQMQNATNKYKIGDGRSNLRNWSNIKSFNY